MDYRDIITIEPGKRSGKECIRGMRITVYDVLSYLAAGMTQAEILRLPTVRNETDSSLPQLRSRSREDVDSCSMKSWFDHNLSPRLVTRLADIFPGSLHVPLKMGGAETIRQILGIREA